MELNITNVKRMIMAGYVVIIANVFFALRYFIAGNSNIRIFIGLCHVAGAIVVFIYVIPKWTKWLREEQKRIQCNKRNGMYN